MRVQRTPQLDAGCGCPSALRGTRRMHATRLRRSGGYCDILPKVVAWRLRMRAFSDVFRVGYAS